MSPIPPGSTLGILGGGQLGRMLAQSARQHGYGVVVLAPLGDAPAAGLADHAIRASFEDIDAARDLARRSDVVTYEFENVPAATARAVEALAPLRPSAELLAVTQDRLEEHALLHRLGVPTAPGWPVRSGEDLDAGLRALGMPARLKSSRGGYDGGGQYRIVDAIGHAAARAAVGRGGAWLLEAEVAFERELSVIVARGADGDLQTFPLLENLHEDGILRLTRVPARVTPRLAEEAHAIARTLAEATALVGTLTVECFVEGDHLRVNELAPRVHNSGHLTMEACTVSQFEQHLRAICGLPLAVPELRSPAAMWNLLGEADVRPVRLQGAEAVLATPGAHLHLYGKSSARERRKMGHVTVLADDADRAERVARACGTALRIVPG